MIEIDVEDAELLLPGRLLQAVVDQSIAGEPGQWIQETRHLRSDVGNFQQQASDADKPMQLPVPQDQNAFV
ncbi:hypothetical protein D3C81_1853110 [compost metagenome]